MSVVISNAPVDFEEVAAALGGNLPLTVTTNGDGLYTVTCDGVSVDALAAAIGPSAILPEEERLNRVEELIDALILEMLGV